MVKELLIHIDGAAKGNPGPAAIGLVGHTPEGDPVFEHSRYIGETTNNVAEYTALIQGLKIALEKGFKKVRVASDSELLVRQINGLYRVKTPHLQTLFDQAVRLMEQFKEVDVFHVPREQNKEADALANQAIKKRAED